MARQIPDLPDSSNIDAVNLTRLLSRLDHNVLSSSADTKLLRSSAHRARVNANLEYARTLLLRLEHTKSSIKIQSRKQATQADLLKKRELIKRLSEQLYEYSQADEDDISDPEDGSEEEDLLGEDLGGVDPTTASSTTVSDPLDRRKGPPDTETTSTLRSRNLNASQGPAAASTSKDLFAHSQPIDTVQSSSVTLISHAAEQETLTTSLLSLASQLKSSSLAFQTSLESEKSTLSRATEGLDRNTSGMEAAGKRMGVLRKMSEGRGLFGRLMLYAWIGALLVAAILLVFVGPKLRF